MAKKILVTHSYFLKFDPKQMKAGNAYPPLGSLILASCLKETGVSVSFFDTMFVQSPLEIESEILKVKPEILIICDDSFNYLTKMCLSNMREAAFEMIKIAKKQNIIVIVNSSDASDNSGLYIEKGADFVVSGESEPSIVELTQVLSESAEIPDLTKIQNLVYKKEGKIIINNKREVLKNLDSLPFPAWDLADIATYKSFWLKNKGYFSLNMVTTRGCPYKCNWCAKPIYGNRYNSRSPEKVVEEIKYLIENFQIDHIWFADDIFGLKPNWLSEFAELIQKNNVKIRYKIQSRADLMDEKDSVTALAKSGCEEVWLGAESGSQRILDAMDKGITVTQIRNSIHLLKQHKIRTAFFLQFGYLNENQEDINATINMVLELMPDDIGISVSYPLPGTKFYDKVKSDLKEKTNWTDSDELAMMFQNTFPPAYYWNLQKYVHSIYRLKKNKKEMAINPLRKAVSIPYNFATSLYYKSRLESSISHE